MSRSELLLAPPDDRLHLWPVSKRVNRTGNVDGPRPFIGAANKFQDTAPRGRVLDQSAE
jgi:hypothetical protein